MRATFLQAGLILAAGLYVDAPAWHGAFLWDDPQYLTANPLLADPAGLARAWFVPGSVMEFYPLQETVLWLQWHFFGAQPLGYHLTNVLLHVLSALLLWRLFTQLGLRHGWLGGLLFAVHPANVESVAWISELKNTLSLPPFLVAMTALVRFYDSGRRRDYLISLAVFTLSLLAKISMAPFPFVILLYAWWRNGRVTPRDARLAAPFLVVAVLLSALTVFAYLRFGALHPGHPVVPEIGGPLARLALTGLAVSFYFVHLVLPFPLLPMYPAWSLDFPDWFSAAAWIGWLCLLAGLWRRRVTYGRPALLALGFFLLMIAPFSGLATQSYMYFTWIMDHFLYIAMIGPIGLVVAAVDRWLGFFSRLGQVLVLGGVATVVLLFTVQSRAYAAQWRDGETLWAYTVAREPSVWLAHYNLGNAYSHDGRIDDAIAEYRQSIRLHPGFDWSHNNLGICLAESQGPAAAIDEYRTAIRLRSAFAEAHNNLANALSQTGHLDEAVAEYRAALAAQHDFLAARYNLAIALLEAGRNQEAAAQCREIIREHPDFTPARLMLQACR